MVQTLNAVALKEWAVVIRAMAEWDQVILFRKGGIVERNQHFEVESPAFFLYPTYLHQTPDLLRPDVASWIPDSEAERPSPHAVSISYYATVENVLEAKGIERLRTLGEATIWTPDYVEKTWAWEPEKPAYVLFLRVYRLPRPYRVQERPEYGGCKSWIHLETPLPVTDLEPILTDEDFHARCRAIETALGQTMVHV